MIYLLLFIALIAIIVALNRQKDRASQHQPARSAFLPRHSHAREYILKSGDEFAVKELRQIENRPEAYSYYFWKHSDNNHTLRIALGLVTGYLTWELLNDGQRESELQQAMDRLEYDLENDLVPRESDLVEQEEQAMGLGYDDDDEQADGETDDGMERLYADLDDTQYFEEMMDD